MSTHHGRLHRHHQSLRCQLFQLLRTLNCTANTPKPSLLLIMWILMIILLRFLGRPVFLTVVTMLALVSLHHNNNFFFWHWFWMVSTDWVLNCCGDLVSGFKLVCFELLCILIWHSSFLKRERKKNIKIVTCRPMWHCLESLLCMWIIFLAISSEQFTRA